MTRTVTFLDQTGHTSLGWDEQDDEWVLPMIRAKMAEGYVFWIVRRDPLREVQLTRAEDATQSRHVIIRDDSARRLFEEGRIGVVRGEDDASMTRERTAQTAEEVVTNDTVAHRPLRGG